MRCATHPEVETNLTCGKCDTPICPKCLVQTPVGARCPGCAQIRRLPIYEITPLQYLKAVGVGLGLAVAIGLAWAFLWDFVHFFNFLLAAGVGYAIGELVSLSVNRKRGTGLPVIGGFCVVLSYIIAKLTPWGVYFGLWDLLVLAVGIFVVVSRLR